MCSYHNLKITFHKSVVGNILECSSIPKIIKIWLCFKLEVQSALKYRSLMLKRNWVGICHVTICCREFF